MTLDPCPRLRAQTCDAHIVEFIQIRPRNRQEPEAFKQGVARVLGLFQHSTVESQPGKFPVEKAVRAFRTNHRHRTCDGWGHGRV